MSKLPMPGWMRWLMPLVGALLSACATAPEPLAVPTELFNDARFAPPAEPIDPDAAFTASEAMRRYVHEDMAPLLRRHGLQWGLIEALRSRAQLRLEYDSERTRSAAETFDARAGNCLALVLMTASFARELGLPVRFQAARVPDTWSRSGDLYLRSGHVNLVLEPRFGDGVVSSARGGVVIDFLPPEQAETLRTRPIDEATVLAMFLNNRAVEAMVQGRLDDAYAWAREALRRQPGYLAAYNTLGVVYLRHGDLRWAERVLDRVLAQAGDDVQALSNLAAVYAREGRAAEAAVLEQRIARLDPHPPFQWFRQGRDAMERGDYRAARDLFEREVEREPTYHEFQFWLAQAYWRLGDERRAREHLALAARYSSVRHDRDLYEAKLAWLRAHP